MITIGIDPVAFSIGSVNVMWYGIMVVLAVVVVIVFALMEAKRVGLARDHIYNAALWAIIGGVIVSRLMHVIDQWDYYMENPAQIVNFAGLSIYGAVLGAMLAVVIYCLVNKLSVWQLVDIAAPGALLGQAIGRVGCIIGGCCYGLENPSFCAIEYVHPSRGLYSTPVGVPLYPTQIYHLVWNLVAFGILWTLRTKLKPKGTVFLSYLALYALGDLVIRFFRQGTPFLFGMQQAQVIGILILLVTVPWLAVKLWRGRKASG
ncbi:MAG: prolipoprotein diacylglyceryl transferase [Chloroflexi bacterium]|nr:prolipoprotein diacylglyceryl transferase [Chloroflexota bacterium]